MPGCIQLAPAALLNMVLLQLGGQEGLPAPWLEQQVAGLPCTALCWLGHPQAGCLRRGGLEAALQLRLRLRLWPAGRGQVRWQGRGRAGRVRQCLRAAANGLGSVRQDASCVMRCPKRCPLPGLAGSGVACGGGRLPVQPPRASALLSGCTSCCSAPRTLLADPGLGCCLPRPAAAAGLRPLQPAAGRLGLWGAPGGGARESACLLCRGAGQRLLQRTGPADHRRCDVSVQRAGRGRSCWLAGATPSWAQGPGHAPGCVRAAWLPRQGHAPPRHGCPQRRAGGLLHSPGCCPPARRRAPEWTAAACWQHNVQGKGYKWRCVPPIQQPCTAAEGGLWCKCWEPRLSGQEAGLERVEVHSPQVAPGLQHHPRVAGALRRLLVAPEEQLQGRGLSAKRPRPRHTCVWCHASRTLWPDATASRLPLRSKASEAMGRPKM